MPRALRRLFFAAISLLIFSRASDARADAVSFGAHDVRTVFFINKSDDQSRVDYGIHLTENCVPISDDAIYLYWHEFGVNPPRTHTLGVFEYVPYGLSEHHLVHRTQTGGDMLVRLKQLDRPILVTTKKEADGSCSAIARARDRRRRRRSARQRVRASRRRHVGRLHRHPRKKPRDERRLDRACPQT